jgi:hypothetical protein
LGRRTTSTRQCRRRATCTVERDDEGEERCRARLTRAYQQGLRHPGWRLGHRTSWHRHRWVIAGTGHLDGRQPIPCAVPLDASDFDANGDGVRPGDWSFAGGLGAGGQCRSDQRALRRSRDWPAGQLGQLLLRDSPRVADQPVAGDASAGGLVRFAVPRPRTNLVIGLDAGWVSTAVVLPHDRWTLGRAGSSCRTMCRVGTDRSWTWRSSRRSAVGAW